MRGKKRISAGISYTFPATHFLLLLLTSRQFYSVQAFSGGGWCPYKSTRAIPCRVQNGTETYLSPDMCWVHQNGTTVCTKRVLRRPKYITTYKRVPDTAYRCCPGLEGNNCQTECFNCNSIKKMESKMNRLESRISELDVFLGYLKQLEKASASSDTEDLANTIKSEEDEYPIPDTGDSAKLISLISEMRGVENRLTNLETQLASLAITIESLVRFNRDSFKNEPRSQHGINSLIKDSFPTRGGPATNLASSSISAKSPKEDNLERGDIAATLNDDYDEELSSPTEEYADLLHIRT